ncbi:MAG: antibiotic biosynthesis monooxygenase [Dehalococcoidia bacterium]|nr:MAG: antibiotic biosynthesis monooxygenase [Dehalococcoidia bacterium]
MFVLVVRFRVTKGKERELEELFKKARVNAHKEEKNLLIYDLHHKIDDSAEILLYERYRDRKDWEVTHRSKPYIKELLAELPKYIEGDVILEEYELVEFD